MKKKVREAIYLFRLLASRICTPSNAVVIVLFAFSGWPFFWGDHTYAKLGSLFFLLIMSVNFLASKKRARFNVFLSAFSAYLLVISFSTLASERTSIQLAFPSRAAVYLLFWGGALAMSSVEFDEFKKAANWVMWLYLAISLPSVLIFLSLLLGIDLPYSNIGLSGRGIFIGCIHLV